jgi:hypothetical protein
VEPRGLSSRLTMLLYPLTRRSPDYALAGSACGLLAPLLAYALLRPGRRTLAIGALVLGACAGLSGIVFAGSMLWSSSGGV